MNPRILRWTSVVLTVVGVAFMGYALWSDADGLDWGLLPGPGVSVVMVALLATSLFVSYGMWVLVLRTPPTSASLSTYMAAQVAKYVPGGVWQGVGQVTGHVGSQSRTSVVTTSVAYLVQAGGQVAAAAPLALVVLLVAPPRQPVVLLGVVATVGAAVLVVRPLMAIALRWLGRWRTTWADQLILPTQGRILGAASLGVLTLVLQGLVLAWLVAAPGTGWLPVAAAYGVAWAVGFAALPLPSGFGLREFMLVSLVPDVQPGVIVAASLILRVGQILAEVLVLVATQAWHRSRTQVGPAVSS